MSWKYHDYTWEYTMKYTIEMHAQHYHIKLNKKVKCFVTESDVTFFLEGFVGQNLWTTRGWHSSFVKVRPGRFKIECGALVAKRFL